MSLEKRKLLKGITALGFVATPLPKIWFTPVISLMTLPAHAMTSSEVPEACSNLETETVDESITITVSDTGVVGPVVATRTGQSFSVELTLPGGLCADGITAMSSSVEFNGTIDSATNRIEGNFNVRELCGDDLACEQIATFVATQIPLDTNSDLGVYEGRVIGTLKCCLDVI